MLCCSAASRVPLTVVFFFFNDTATTEIYTLSLHDALPISTSCWRRSRNCPASWGAQGLCGNQQRGMACSSRVPISPRWRRADRSEEHTSELQSPCNLVCRLLLEKKKSS